MWQLLSVVRVGLLICIIRRIQSQQLHVIVERGQNTTLECSVPNTVNSVTWRVLNATNNEVSLTTCNPPNACTDQGTRQYKGHIASSPGGYTSTLEVPSAKIEETQFTCLTDAGNVVANISLEVYVMPSNISCSQSLIINEYVNVTCETEHVYPGISAILSRREPYSSGADYSSCNVYLDGPGSNNVYFGSCTWRVPFSSLLDSNTFYVTMFAMVWNDTEVGQPAVSSDIVVSFSVGQVSLDKKDCPVGPGVIGEYITIGTTATCKCQLSAPGLVTSRARWYTQDGEVVGTEDPRGQFSVLTLAYNASNESPTYDCRADNPSLVYDHLLYTPKYRGQHVIVEKGHSTTLECSVPNTVKSVTWHVLNATNNEVSLTTCNPPNACTDQGTQQYKGHIASSPGGYTSTLEVPSANIEETQFTCLTDAGHVAANISLEVYVMPSNISCSQSLIINEYVDVTCETEHVYPGFSAALRRREPYNFTTDANYSSCNLLSDGSGSDNGYIGSCTWRVPFSSLLDSNTFYVTMFAMVWNDTEVGQPAVSSDIVVSFSVGQVSLDKKDCPVGPGVIGEYITIGTTATCKCQLSAPRLVTSRARWYTQDGAVVATEDPSGQFSVLTLAYNASNKSPTYDCRAANPSAWYNHIPYTPKFTSSAPQSLTSGLSFVMAIGAACTSMALTLVSA